MAEYIRKQDAVEALDGKIIVTGRENADAVLQYMKDITNKIKSIEPADVEQVVRCRKCKYFWTYRCMDSMPIETCELAQTFYNPDSDFCSLAKRREE